MKSLLIHLISLGTLLFIATGCVTTTTNRGYTFDDEKLQQLSLNTTTKDEVLKILGSPSTYNDYGDETWFYVGKETESVAFLKPKTVKQKIVALTFDNGGTLTDIKNYSEKDAREIATVNETTPTYGKSLGVLQQLLGNIGKYNSRTVDYSQE